MDRKYILEVCIDLFICNIYIQEGNHNYGYS